jgi:hypothetical protein
MLFAVWTENRATEEVERDSILSRRTSPSNHTISRQASATMSSPAIRLDVISQDNDATDLKLSKLEANEALEDTNDDDVRPAVFSSTFLEICCIASLVCGQLTNVWSRWSCR